MPTTTLPGLDRLITICQQHSLSLELSPPRTSAPQAGQFVLGEPFDPQLAAVYQRLGAATFGPLTLHGPGQDENDLIPKNEWVREENEIYFHEPLIFGKETGFSLYHGTVPRLADSRELQPVVYISAHDTPQFAIPIASSVDRFFDLYSRYLERMVADFEYIETGVSLVTFPWDMADLIRRDEPLIAQVRAGRFDFLTNDYAGAQKWLKELLSPPSSPS
jgi:hypothetical protein